MVWPNGEMMKVILDTDKGEMEFFIEEKLLGKIEIENTRDYYPVFVISANEGTNCKLIAEI